MGREERKHERIVAPIAIKHGVKKIKLFGSRARGEEHAQSDYDFLINSENPA
ncbi:MAG: nucleotidyltransferase domain-containing protein [Synergistaceae bacterium]|nr:nucleotidyltransferase domain-containing protein [Synergistaceae bacterium]